MRGADERAFARRAASSGARRTSALPGERGQVSRAHERGGHYADAFAVNDHHRFSLHEAARDLRGAADEPATQARDLLRRARARLQLGRDALARADLQACRDELGDEAAIELAFLDLRARGGVESARDQAERIAQCAPPGSALEARALHVLGLAEGKLRRHPGATDALLRARDRYRALRDERHLAQVQDTLGSLFAAQGRVDLAASQYAISIVGKLRENDAAGIALTLGNLGRLHLRTARFADALDCFRLDAGLARDLGDERGIARMHEDLGRAHQGLEQWREARDELGQALALGRLHGFHDILVFALVDLGLVELANGSLEAARTHADAAQAELGRTPDAFLESLVLALHGRIFAAERSPRAIELLEHALERFVVLDLPDHEIPTCIALAEVHLALGARAPAEAALRRALEAARRDGFARYLPSVREAMARLSIVESLVDEQRRLGAPGERALGTDGYQLLARVGSGAFGEVWRAFDPQRGCIVALKRFHLERLYSPARRESVLASARTELAAASFLRHPGLARVFALGTDGAGATYVVQEYVEGTTLRARMKAGRAERLERVLTIAGQVARALEALHRAGVVHRDLKPENVLLRAPSDLPVLIDFGLAHVPDAAEPRGAVRGSLPYMAPEQARGLAVDGAADVYALGVIVYEWLAGFRPLALAAEDVEAQLEAIQDELPLPLAGARPDLDPECTDLVDAMLEKRPGDRPPIDLVARRCEAWSR